MTANREVSNALNEAFGAAFLLTGCSEAAENAVLDGIAAFAQAAESRMPVTDAEKIADALRAGPLFVTKDATLVDWPSTPIDLEGRDLIAVPLGHTDIENTTCLHVPSIGLVVAGDAAYNGVHLQLNESDPQSRREWIAALDTIEALHPSAVIAGHKRAENDDSPRIIEETR